VPLIALAVALLVVLAAIALMPLTLVQRYRVGTARRLARGWVTSLNLIAIGISTVFFLVGAGVTSIWVPWAFTYALGGLVVGCVAGLLGLALTRWEASPSALHYTPNRWLVLAITLTVTCRLLYGFWRGWETWRAALDHTSWLVASGAAGSLGAGAIVLGYYLVYWTGIRRRLRAHNRMAILDRRVRQARRIS
jgi:hypothetical protein